VKNPRIHEAAKLPHVTVLCCHKLRPGLMEKHIERAGIDLFEAHGWLYMPVSAENGTGTGKHRRRDPRAAKKGALDGVVFEKDSEFRTFLVEWKRGDRDLTNEQLEAVWLADEYGISVLICDDIDQLKEWLR